MPSFKIIFLLLFTACSTAVKKYEFAGNPNFNINLQSDSGILGSDEVNIRLLEELGNCQYADMGTVSVTSNKMKSIALPINKKMAYIVRYDKTGFLSPQTTQQENVFYFQTRPQENYELNLSRKDELKEDHFYRIKKDLKKQEEDSKQTCFI